MEERNRCPAGRRARDRREEVQVLQPTVQQRKVMRLLLLLLQLSPSHSRPSLAPPSSSSVLNALRSALLMGGYLSFSRSRGRIPGDSEDRVVALVAEGEAARFAFSFASFRIWRMIFLLRWICLSSANRISVFTVLSCASSSTIAL